MYSEWVMLQDIYVNNTSSNKNPARNTDGANTLFPIVLRSVVGQSRTAIILLL
jgi:hypothetical protein